MKLKKLFTAIKIIFQEKNHITLRTMDIFFAWNQNVKNIFFAIRHYAHFL